MRLRCLLLVCWIYGSQDETLPLMPCYIAGLRKVNEEYQWFIQPDITGRLLYDAFGNIKETTKI